MESTFSERLVALGYPTYDQYLRGEWWQSFRDKYFKSKRTKKVCACCRVPNFSIELHHQTYIRLGREQLNDVIPLCREHHELVHELVKEKYRGKIEYSRAAVALLSPRKGRRRKGLHTPDNRRKGHRRA